MNVIKLLLIALISISIIGLIAIVPWILKSQPLPTPKLTASEKMTTLINIVIVFIMVVTIMVTILSTNNQINESKNSTVEQLGKMQEQIDATKNVAQDYIDKTEVAKKDDRKKEFKETLKVLDLELEHNLSKLKKIRNNLGKGFTYHSLNYSLITLLLYKPSTIEFGGETLYQGLLSMRDRIESFGSIYARFEVISAQRKISENELPQLHFVLNQTEFIIGLCRTLIAKFQKDNNYFLKEETYKNLEKALEMENLYQKEYPDDAYERLKKDVKL